MIEDRIKTQNKEFDAVRNLAEQYGRLMQTAVVDDDYPEVRHAYEGAMNKLIQALVGNGRI